MQRFVLFMFLLITTCLIDLILCNFLTAWRHLVKLLYLTAEKPEFYPKMKKTVDGAESGVIRCAYIKYFCKSAGA